MANRNLTTEVTTLLGQSSSSNAGQVLAGSAIAFGGTLGNSRLADQLTSLTQQLQALQAINQTQIESIEANTNAVSQNTSSKGQGGGSSTVGSIRNTLLDVFGLGSGISPLISGLVSLFGGGGSSQSPLLSPYIQPLSLNLTAGINSAAPNGPLGVDFEEGGQPRPMSSAAATQITVQVQAMDSRSFLDHSDDIANAVRKAMLESTTLNDVIREI